MLRAGQVKLLVVLQIFTQLVMSDGLLLVVMLVFCRRTMDLPSLVVFVRHIDRHELQLVVVFHVAVVDRHDVIEGTPAALGLWSLIATSASADLVGEALR